MGQIVLGIGALGFNLPALLAQLINFGILLVVFSVFMYKPLLKVLDERRKRIEEGLEASEEAKQQLSQTEQQVAAEMARARQEGQALLTQAQQTAARMQEEAREQARLEGERLLERARGEIQLERDAAIAELRREFANLTIIAAERVIKRSLDPAAHRDLIQEVLAEATADGAQTGGRPPGGTAPA